MSFFGFYLFGLSNVLYTNVKQELLGSKREGFRAEVENKSLLLPRFFIIFFENIRIKLFRTLWANTVAEQRFGMVLNI